MEGHGCPQHFWKGGRAPFDSRNMTMGEGEGCVLSTFSQFNQWGGGGGGGVHMFLVLLNSF